MATGPHAAPTCEFRGETVKPTELYGNEWVNLLFRAKPQKGATKPKVQLVSVTRNKDGSRSVTGNSKALTQSQAYPPDFGREVCPVFLKTRPGPLETIGLDDHTDSETASDTDDDWADAKPGGSMLQSVVKVQKAFERVAD